MANFFPLASSSGGKGVEGGEEEKFKHYEVWQRQDQDQQLRMAMRNGHTDNSNEGSRGGGGSTSCEDCGNQAKRECVHMRCRTCCKSRGFTCSTHVKSTWVPASKRRQNQQRQREVGVDGNPPKRLRDHQQDIVNRHHQQLVVSPPSSRDQCTILPRTAGLEVGIFPAEVSSSALFRCVRVSSTYDANDQYAYKTAVNIGGHVFKGILYDEGPDDQYHSVIGESSSGMRRHSGSMPTGSNSSLMFVDPTSSLYPTHHYSSFMSGTQIFPPPTT